jgi:hypothetical protein
MISKRDEKEEKEGCLEERKRWLPRKGKGAQRKGKVQGIKRGRE